MGEYGKHPNLMPKSIGLPMSVFSDEGLLSLPSAPTPSELDTVHAEYYAMMPAPLSEEHKAMLAGPPMDPADAFMPQDYGRYMVGTGYCAVENGYCVLPSGVTYAAALIRQPGRTDEMVDFYNRYFAPRESLFYKTWFPGMHYLHFSDGCLEDFGFGRTLMQFRCFVGPEAFGLTTEEVEARDPDCILIGGSSGVSRNLDSDDPHREERSMITFYHRLTPEGREARIRLWFGIGYEDGEWYRTDVDPEKALHIAHCCMAHLIQEYTNDQYLETKFWEDWHGKEMR